MRTESYWTTRTVEVNCIDDEFLSYINPAGDPLFASPGRGAAPKVCPPPAAATDDTFDIDDILMEGFCLGGPPAEAPTEPLSAAVAAAATVAGAAAGDVAMLAAESAHCSTAAASTMVRLGAIMEQCEEGEMPSTEEEEEEEEEEVEQRAGRAAAAARAARASMARSQRRIWHGYEVAPPTTVKLRLKLRSASTAAAAVAAAAPAPPAATQEQDAGVGHALAASRAARRAKQGSRPSSRGAAEVPGPAQPIAKTRGRRSGSSSSRPRTGLPQNRRKGGMNIPEEDLFLYHLGFIDKRRLAEQNNSRTDSMATKVQTFLWRKVRGALLDGSLMYQVGTATSRPPALSLDKARLAAEGIATWAAFQAKYMSGAAL